MKREFRSTFAPDILSFIEFRNSQGYAIYTTEYYLCKFDAYCLEHLPTTSILTQELVQSWMKDATDHGFVDMFGRGSAIHRFAKYQQTTGKNAYVLPTEYYAAKSSFVPHVLSFSELVAFFLAADSLARWENGDRFAPTIAPVLFRLMYTSGLRPNEVREIRNEDVDLKKGIIHIRINKQKKHRLVVVSDDMLRLLKEYQAKRDLIFVRTDYYFPKADGVQYSTQQLITLCRRCWQAANPNLPRKKLPQLRPYDFRHTFASSVLQKWLDEGKDLYTMLPYLSTYMGHEHIEDTAYYIHILPDRLLESHAVDWELLDSVMPEVGIWD